MRQERVSIGRFIGHCARFAAALLVGSAAGLASGVVVADVPEAPMIAGTPAAAGNPELRIEITAEHLVTLDAYDVELHALLAEVARQTGFVIVSRGLQGRRVTLAFDRLPLPKALGRILSGQSFTMQYFGPANDSPATPNRLWVLSRDSGAPTEIAASSAAVGGAIDLGKAWVGQDPIASIDALLELAALDEPRWAGELGTAALSNPDALVREEAVYALSELASEGSLQVFESALLDPTPRVREAAVLALADTGEERAIPTLAVALNDPDANVREEAIYALSEFGSATVLPLLRRALTDQDESLQEIAAEALAEVDARRAKP